MYNREQPRWHVLKLQASDKNRSALYVTTYLPKYACYDDLHRLDRRDYCTLDTNNVVNLAVTIGRYEVGTVPKVIHITTAFVIPSTK